MHKFAIIGGLAAVLAGGTIATLETAGRTSASPVSASRRVNCLNLSATVTSSQGAQPDVSCLTDGGGASLQITTQSTLAATATPAPTRNATVRTSGGSTNVNVSSSSRTQSSSSSAVIVEQNSQNASSQGSASNTNRSTTNITITNH